MSADNMSTGDMSVGEVFDPSAANNDVVNPSTFDPVKDKHPIKGGARKKRKSGSRKKSRSRSRSGGRTRKRSKSRSNLNNNPNNKSRSKSRSKPNNK